MSPNPRAREAALRHLDLLTQQFVRNVCRRRNVPPEYANKAGGAVFTYGSYKLGVNSAGNKLD
jgi:poly(A) polymerase